MRYSIKGLLLGFVTDSRANPSLGDRILDRVSEMNAGIGRNPQHRLHQNANATKDLQTGVCCFVLVACGPVVLQLWCYIFEPLCSFDDTVAITRGAVTAAHLNGILCEVDLQC